MNEPPRLIANDAATGTIGEELQRALGWVSPQAVAIATAYLTPDGFLSLKNGLQGTESVRLLLGERPFLNRRGPGDVLARPGDPEVLEGPSETVDWYTFLEGGYPWLLLTHDERRQLLQHGESPEKSAFDLSAWERVMALAEFLRRDGVDVRRFLGPDAGKVEHGMVLDHRSPRARLHAKAYLFEGDSSAFASVGSSNLTRSGLEQNTELNVVSRDGEFAAQIHGWFDTKWEQGQDCRQEFIEKLEECVLFGRRYTPWQVFLKSLHAAYGRFLDLGLSEDVATRLAGFQQEAVQRIVPLLERHWGAMLCDSVGLGKTFEALGVVSEFSKRREGRARALFVCPAQLESNWSQEKLIQWSVHGETVTMESLPQLVDLDDATPLERARAETRLRRYQRDFDIIVVDESHNFRNTLTKRYRAMMEILTRGKPDKRVLLLTATPINNTIWDLYNQLSLITRGNDGWYAGRGPVGDLRSTFRAVEQGEGGPGLLDAMMLSLVRRTRHDIRAREAAGEAVEVGGQPLRFPRHEFPEAVTYSLQNLYGAIYHEVLDVVQNLNFAVYQLESYGVRTEAEDTTERVKQRNANFVGIMKTILLKRMESSVVALQATVSSMVEYLDLFLARLDGGQVITPKQAQRLRAVLGGSLPDAEIEASDWDPRAVNALREIRPAPTDPNERARLQVDVEADRGRLQALLDRLRWLEEMWGEKGDPKVAAVRKLIESLPATDEHGVPTKVVIFSNYRDTAEHVFRALGGDPEVLKTQIRVPSSLRDQRWMSLLRGTDDKNRRQAVIERFAPLAMHREVEPLDDPGLQARIRPYRDEGIELLVATDVLSEGQNLQDAQYLINYDLHWNPVRMIQRAGRIDRLNSPHQRVYFYNLMPEQGLEDLLGLVKRLTTKLETIEDAIALDASVLGEQIEAKNFDELMRAYREGGKRAEQIYEEGERTQGLDAGLAFLNDYLEIMKGAALEEVSEIPNGVYSVKQGLRTGVYIMLRMPEHLSGEVFWHFYPLDDLLHPLTSPADVLPVVSAQPDELRWPLPAEVNPFKYLRDPLEAAVHQVAESYQRLAEQQAPSRLVAHLRTLLQRDELLIANETLSQLLVDWCNQPHPADATRRGRMADASRSVMQLRPLDSVDDLLATLRALWEAIEAEGLDRPLPRPESSAPTVRDLELVAWELVVGADFRPMVTPTSIGVGSSGRSDISERTAVERPEVPPWR